MPDQRTSDQQTFVDAMLNPPEPSERLKEAAERYRTSNPVAERCRKWFRDTGAPTYKAAADEIDRLQRIAMAGAGSSKCRW